MKISICIITLNEEKSISSLLISLTHQTKRPDEIIIVDGGSKDKTVEIIRHFVKKDNRIKLFIEKGTIAHCRNISIELATGDIIATIDSGCIANKDWLEKITYHFKHEKVGLIAGFYNMPYINSLQEAIRVYLGILPQKFDQTFLPSARSVAFRKSVWEEVGGFNENLERGGEDTEFFYKCVKIGVKIIREKSARVEWSEVRTFNLKQFLKKVFVYSKGDGEAKIWWHPTKQFSSHNIRITAIFIRYLIGLLFFVYCIVNTSFFSYLIVLIIFYLLYPVLKWKSLIKDNKARLLLPVI
ncbi:MAG: glycosyltransferase, partial [Candidatus Woesebacteria bacterium]|nr:glycosyltransferase [Candidatus Woesebacteria bacterium]